MILISLMQAWDRVTLDGDGDAEVGDNGLDLPAPLHPAEAFLRNGTSEQVENFNFTVEIRPDTKPVYHHLEFIMSLPPMITQQRYILAHVFMQFPKGSQAVPLWLPSATNGPYWLREPAIREQLQSHYRSNIMFAED